MNKLLFIFAFFISSVSFSTTHLIGNSGLAFTEHTIVIQTGDNINFSIGGTHFVREVSEATWNANGTTSNGGFETPAGGGITPAFNTTGIYYYVCPNHIGSLMKGRIIVANLPTLTTTAISSITSTTAASGATITDDGGSLVAQRGVCWSTSPNPVTTNTKDINGATGTGSFSSSLTGLTPNTTYFVRAYAINAAGIAYGNEESFTTSIAVVNIPTLTTTAISTITSSTAQSGGNITNDGGGTITERGLCWSLTSNPTTSDSKVINGSTGTGIFTGALSGLTSNTTYFVRAYAINSAGTAYGDEKSFTTSVSAGLIHSSFKSNVSFYPNPANEIIRLDIASLNSKSLEVRILNIEGVVVYTKAIHNFNGDFNGSIDLTSVSKGMHYIQLVTDTEILTDKLMVE